MRPFKHLLLTVLGPAALAGILAGTYRGWHYLGAGFPLLLVDMIRRCLMWTLLGSAGFAALFVPLRRLAARLTDRFGTAAASALAAAPFVALGGLAVNRSGNIHPSEILEPYALKRNLAYLAACAVAWAAVAFFLHRRATSRRPRAAVPAAALLLLALLQVGSFVFFRPEKKTLAPDVLLILVDALRADHLGCYGYDRDTSPAIDSLARDGVTFRYAIAQSTFTKTSVASLFTGRFPFRHGVYYGQREVESGALVADLLGAGETTLAERMHDKGYLTAAWVQNSHLRRVMGFAQGFVDYHDQQGSQERIHRRFIPWLDGPGRRYGYFAYLHYIDLHDPYLPEPPYDTLFGDHVDVYRGVDLDRWGAYLRAVREGERILSAAEVDALRALYDGQLRAVDDGIGRLLDRLRESGLYDETLIVVTADHGDAFMEHGFISHSRSPYEELIRVPLVLKLPGGRFAGRVVESQVRLVDVMPTLLAAVGAGSRMPEVDGCNLLPWIREGKRPPAAEAHCAVSVVEIAEHEGAPTLAVRTDRYKYIHRENRDDELYDLVEDPGERHNLAASPPEGGAALGRLARELVAERRATEGVDRMELPQEILKELRALGYVE